MPEITGRELPQQWSLKVLKSVLPSTVFTYGLFRLGDSNSTADTNHIFQTIVNEASNGARLVCVTITGFNSQNVSQPGATSAAAGAFGGNAAMNVCFFGQSPQMSKLISPLIIMIRTYCICFSVFLFGGGGDILIFQE